MAQHKECFNCECELTAGMMLHYVTEMSGYEFCSEECLIEYIEENLVSSYVI